MARPRTQARKTGARSTMVRSKDRATSTPAARRAALKRIRDEKVEHVLFWFTDLEGHLKSFAVTPSEIEVTFASPDLTEKYRYRHGVEVASPLIIVSRADDWLTAWRQFFF